VTTISTSAKQQSTSQFAADILKGGGLPLEERLDAKLKILEDLRERGVWLLDVSIFGWYIAQPQKYKKSVVTNEIHRMTKQVKSLMLSSCVKTHFNSQLGSPCCQIATPAVHESSQSSLKASLVIMH
jgi:hypothetical protein